MHQSNTEASVQRPASADSHCRRQQRPTVIDWHQPRTVMSAQRPAGIDSDQPSAESSLQGATVVEWHQPNFRKQCREPSRCRTPPAQCRQQCAGANRFKLEAPPSYSAGGRVRSTLLGVIIFDDRNLKQKQADLDDNLANRHSKTRSDALRGPFGTIPRRF